MSRKRARAASLRPIQQPAPLLSEYFDKTQLAAQLGRDPQTLERWHRLGIGPPRVKLGRKPLYKKSAVLEWLESQASA